jgi:hypothetical protein
MSATAVFERLPVPDLAVGGLDVVLFFAVLLMK